MAETVGNIGTITTEGLRISPKNPLSTNAGLNTNPVNSATSPRPQASDPAQNSQTPPSTQLIASSSKEKREYFLEFRGPAITHVDVKALLANQKNYHTGSSSKPENQSGNLLAGGPLV